MRRPNMGNETTFSWVEMDAWGFNEYGKPLPHAKGGGVFISA